MGTATLIIANAAARAKAARWCSLAPWNTRVTFKASSRTLPQNATMWARLTDVSQQVEWYGEKYTPEEWKDILSASLRQSRVVPGVEKGTFVILGLRTSKMDIEQMSNLLELITAFGAEHGVVWHDKEEIAA